jgi:hypothetical protein
MDHGLRELYGAARKGLGDLRMIGWLAPYDPVLVPGSIEDPGAGRHPGTPFITRSTGAESLTFVGSGFSWKVRAEADDAIVGLCLTPMTGN